MSRPDVAVTIEPNAPDGFAALVESIVFVRGPARYRRVDVASTLARFRSPRFVVARRGERLVGGCVLDARRLRLGEARVQGLYRGLLCVAGGERGLGTGRAIVRAAFDEADALAARAGEPVLSYGCIDRHNAASLALLTSLGAHRLGSLAAVLRYRQWPRERVALDREAVAASGCGIIGTLEDRTDDDAERVGWAVGGSHASCAAVASTLRFDTLGRMADAAVAWTVTPFPFARRRFDPERFRYVSLRDLRGGGANASLTGAALDSLLAHHGCHYAMLVGDPSHPQAGTWGIAGATPSLDVLGRWHGAEGERPAIDALAVYPVDL